MRLRGIKVEAAPPIDLFEVDDLSDLVVIAGPNGVGKSQLVNHVLNAFRSPAIPHASIKVEATNQDERDRLAAMNPLAPETVVDSTTASGQAFITSLLQSNKRRRYFQSGVMYYESNRSIQNVSPLAFQFEFSDPFEELVGYDMAMQPLSTRWQDTQHAIFKKLHQQTNQIASRARTLQLRGVRTMDLKFEDPLEPFRQVFASLLGPKTLTKADLQNQQIMYSDGGTELPITSLSSGEREVVNIAFDFLLRSPSDCVVFFDEPELHLHPELLSRLVTTLRAIGERNQFVFVSHSPELVSSSLDDTVVLLTPRKENKSNQAVILKKDDESYAALKAIGQSIGIVSLGKRIVLIEGEDASLDRAVYGEIIRNRYDDLVLLPSGGRETIDMFSKVYESVLARTVWGIDFFMLTDRDTVPQEGSVNPRMRTLGRYHLENYFLNPRILAACFADMEPEVSWLRNEIAIAEKLQGFASDSICYATSLVVSQKLRFTAGNLSLMPKLSGVNNAGDLKKLFRERAQVELSRLNAVIEPSRIDAEIDSVYDDLNAKVLNGYDAWVVDFPGKLIFSRLCGAANIDKGRLKSLYISQARKGQFDCFDEIAQIFESFSDRKGLTKSGPIKLRKRAPRKKLVIASRRKPQSA